MSLAAGRSRSHIREATTSEHTDQPGRQQSERGWIIWRTRGTISMKRRSRAAHGDGPCKEWTQLQPGVGGKFQFKLLGTRQPSELGPWTTATPHSPPLGSTAAWLTWPGIPAFLSLGWLLSFGHGHGPPSLRGPELTDATPERGWEATWKQVLPQGAHYTLAYLLLLHSLPDS